ncbi:MAG: NAD-dependent succinate-semialdehyde dehydrogenase [Rhodobacteraceae bacterium]|nr:NAD-dependent succinate-semialdehyde dehydrogenase [Paracoccaceae bacterium]MCY4197329.1 NAD-dependent succinate-semialdehyde dehydrogenase [Paracoccaceae bacterium]MCY4326939.1 NAD-dependent succinate-semialdehyde dehydrogenase [Paracoccaceae bacterium]
MLDKTNLVSLLKDPSLLATKAYIGGEWIDADDGTEFDVINPARGDVVARVPNLGIAEAQRAIDAAAEVQAEWAARPAKDRSAIILEWYRLMIDNAQDLGMILTAEMGKPIAEAIGEVNFGASFLQWFGEEAKRIYGETVPGPQTDKRLFVIKQPVGVVASITPWNFPSAMIARKMAPALAVGCTFVGRPARETPLSALAMAVLAERAGVPKGAFSIVTSTHSREIGEEFCTNEKVRKITFTGSTEVGRILLQQAGGQVKKVSMELGGNAPFIVFDDADVDAAVEGAMMSKYRNNGQTCVCANRIYVQSGIYDEFAEKLAKAANRLKLGDGLDTKVDTGPLINQDAVDKVRSHVADATAKGGKILAGGKAHELGGYWFEPTVISNVTQEMLIAHDETFGPVAPLIRFDSENEVIALANDTIFGLAAYFYAKDTSRVWRVAEALEFGIVAVNTGLFSTEAAPFGGVKQSGLGREGSHHGADDFLELKYICLSI